GQQIVDPRCKARFGNFPDPSSCERFISCWGGRGFSQPCGNKQVFHPVTGTCQTGLTCPDDNIPSSDPQVIEFSDTPLVDSTSLLSSINSSPDSFPETSQDDNIPSSSDFSAPVSSDTPSVGSKSLSSASSESLSKASKGKFLYILHF
ncbi:unnamed protein product, partial [Meganyctiphanes norvegica]